MGVGFEPIESPLKHYIHEDLIDKRPSFKNKKNAKSEKSN